PDKGRPPKISDREFQVCFPDNIFVIRGNHEEESLNQLYSFATEVHAKFDAKSTDAATARDPMYDHFKNVFMNLPLACLIGRDILAMHGGISPKLRSLQDIREIARPIDEFMKGTLACDLVWSDPDTLNKVETESEDDHPWTSGPYTAYSPRRLADGLLITLFSAPAYKGSSEDTVNLGAYIEVPVSGELVVKQVGNQCQICGNK
ncbi:hypothetical protein COOONC_26342, partial [Cooperia oncophora]